jgi:hypothetical protein
LYPGGLPPGFLCFKGLESTGDSRKSKKENTMAGLNKRELTGKPLRMDTRMAKDLEKLAGTTGHSQNEIIGVAIKRYLFENREYFVEDMVQELCIEPLEREVLLMHNEVCLSVGNMNIKVERQAEMNGAGVCVSGAELPGGRGCKAEDKAAIESDKGKTTESLMYDTHIEVKNRAGEVFYEDDRCLDVNGTGWNEYTELIHSIARKCVDLDNSELLAYFRERFLYE